MNAFFLSHPTGFYSSPWTRRLGIRGCSFALLLAVLAVHFETHCKFAARMMNSFQSGRLQDRHTHLSGNTSACRHRQEVGMVTRNCPPYAGHELHSSVCGMHLIVVLHGAEGAEFPQLILQQLQLLPAGRVITP